MRHGAARRLRGTRSPRTAAGPRTFEANLFPRLSRGKDFSMPLSSRVGAVQTGLRRWFNAHRDGSSPKVNRQDLHLNERADETGLGEFRCLRSRFAQGQFPCTAEGLQHGNKARHVSRQAKPRWPVRLQQSLSNVLGSDGAAVFLAPPIRAVHASPFDAPTQHAAVEELTDIAGRHASAGAAPACDLYSLCDHRDLLSVMDQC